MWPQGFDTPGITKTQVFYAMQSAALTSGTSWQTWTKTPGMSMVFILMVAAGGGGGKGAGGAATVAPGGGGSGGMSRLLIPAYLLPDTIYVRPGNGGLGATASGNGTAGTTSYIAAHSTAFATTPAQAALIMSQAGGGGGGGAATTTAGAAGAIGVATGGPWQSLGLWTSIAGVAGTAGATVANGNGSALTVGAGGLILSGGTGGGNGTGVGGAITTAGPWPPITGGVGTTGGPGNHGIRTGLNLSQLLGGTGLPQPLVFCGGTGGGGHGTGAAGVGGNGAYGCGGGGGGNSSTAGGTAGNGGNGGDGFVFITAW